MVNRKACETLTLYTRSTSVQLVERFPAILPSLVLQLGHRRIRQEQIIEQSIKDVKDINHTT